MDLKAEFDNYDLKIKSTLTEEPQQQFFFVFFAECQTMKHFRFSLQLLFVVVIACAVFLVADLLYKLHGNHQQTTLADSFKSLRTSFLSNSRNKPTKSDPPSDKNDFIDIDVPSTTETHRDNFPATPTTSSDPSDRRRSLLIYGADRSGTTFISRMFSEDPQVFTIYEPLWVTKRWRKAKPETNWSNSELEVVNGILSCNFPDFPMATQFLGHTSKNWAVAPFKNPFQTPNFCNVSDTGQLSCPNFLQMPKFAQERCLTMYKHSVTKVAQVRVPDKKLSSIVPQVFLDNPDTDVKVIQLLRDPRGNMNSRIQLGWMPKHTSPAFARQVRYPCEETAENVKYGRSLPEKYQDRYMEVYYRDIAKHPVRTAMRIYSFAGFEISEDLIKWIVYNTSPSEEALARESGKYYSSVRNSTANAEKWRSAPAEQNRIIERECKELMQLLGIET